MLTGETPFSRLGSVPARLSALNPESRPRVGESPRLHLSNIDAADEVSF
jgi:hypothetical protein